MMKQISTGLLLCLALFLALTAMAKNKRYEVSLGAAVQAGSTQLKPGTYELEVDKTTGTATFYKGKNEVAKISVHCEELTKKFAETSVTARGDKLLSIELGGTNTKVNVVGS